MERYDVQRRGSATVNDRSPRLVWVLWTSTLDDPSRQRPWHRNTSTAPKCTWQFIGSKDCCANTNLLTYLLTYVAVVNNKLHYLQSISDRLYSLNFCNACLLQSRKFFFYSAQTFDPRDFCTAICVRYAWRLDAYERLAVQCTWLFYVRYQVSSWCDEADELFINHQRLNMPAASDVADLLDKLDYCNVKLLRHQQEDRSATPNTVIITTAYLVF